MYLNPDQCERRRYKGSLDVAVGRVVVAASENNPGRPPNRQVVTTLLPSIVLSCVPCRREAFFEGKVRGGLPFPCDESADANAGSVS